MKTHSMRGMLSSDGKSEAQFKCGESIIVDISDEGDEELRKHLAKNITSITCKKCAKHPTIVSELKKRKKAAKQDRDPNKKHRSNGQIYGWNGMEGHRMRLYCNEDTCKKYTVVMVHSSSVGSTSNKKYGHFDIRNIGFICPNHQESYEEHYKEQGWDKTYGDLGKGKCLI